MVVRRGGRTVREAVSEWRQTNTASRPSEARHTPPGEGQRASNAAVARVAGLDRYAVHFATAGALERQIITCLGLTDSG